MSDVEMDQRDSRRRKVGGEWRNSSRTRFVRSRPLLDGPATFQPPGEGGWCGVFMSNPGGSLGP